MGDQTSTVGGASGQGYAGDVDCTEAWDILNRDTAAVLVDVRTVPEWEFVGIPDLGSIGKKNPFGTMANLSRTSTESRVSH